VPPAEKLLEGVSGIETLKALAADSAHSKDDLFALCGPDADQARWLYNPRGDQTLDDLKQAAH